MQVTFTKGPILKSIIFFSIPLLIGNIFQSLYVVVDTIVVGQFVGIDALAAIGSVGTLVFLILGFINGMTSGCAVISAQRFGAEDIEGLKKSFATSITIGFVFTIAFMIIGILVAKPLLLLINTPVELVDMAYTYVLIIYLGAISSTAYNALANIIRSLGDSKTPLYFLIISSIINIFFNLLFTVVIKLGISGVAYATLIAQSVSAVLCVLYIKNKQPLLHLKKHHFKWCSQEVLNHIKVALPMAFQYSIISIGFIFVQSAINAFGTDAIAAIAIANKIEQFAILIFPVLGTALATYCAQNLGANQPQRISKGVFQTLLLAMLIAIIGSISILLFMDPLISIFTQTSNHEVILLCKQYLSFNAPGYILLSIIFIIRQSLQGLGITLFALIVSIVELVVRCIVSMFLPTILSFTGICLATPIAWIFASTMLSIRYVVYLKKKSSSN